MRAIAALQPPALRAAKRSTARNSSTWAIPLCLAALLALQFWLVLFRTINWDEFWFYSQVEQFHRGELTMALQTLHVRLFAWLPILPGSAVDRIIAGRTVMFACEMVSLAAIFVIARKFADQQTALLCCIGYLSAGFVMQHGFSFRTDPLAAAGLMASLAILARARLNPLAIGGFALLMGAAFLVTMKSILFAPAFFGIAWLRWSEDGFVIKSAVRLSAMAILSVSTAAAIFVWHSGWLASFIAAESANSGSGTATNFVTSASTNSVAASAAQKMFFIGMPENWAYIVDAATTGPMFAILCLLTPAAMLTIKAPMAQRIAWMGLFLPLTTLAVYHNTLPYFYAFILPPVAVSLVPAIVLVRRRYSALIVLGAMAAPAIGLWLIDPPSELAKQRAITQAADEIFPEPVAYFDFPAMLSHFPKVNRFTTRWGREGYLSGGGPSYREIMQQRAVPLLLVNDDLATAHFYDLMVTNPQSAHFRPEDQKALRENYVEFWGPFWLAGKQIEPATEPAAREFLVPGLYTITGSPLEIDGQDFPMGGVIELERGLHTIRNSGSQQAQLIWGDRLKKPTAPEPERPYWTDF